MSSESNNTEKFRCLAYRSGWLEQSLRSSRAMLTAAIKATGRQRRFDLLRAELQREVDRIDKCFSMIAEASLPMVVDQEHDLRAER